MGLNEIRIKRRIELLGLGHIGYLKNKTYIFDTTLCLKFEVRHELSSAAISKTKCESEMLRLMSDEFRKTVW